MIAEALEEVRRRIAGAARRAGRDPAGVRLICVTKGVDPAYIEEALAAGVTEIGENRVQEAKQKKALLGTVPFGDSPLLRWHMIGHLQRNKAKLASEVFDALHSVDSLELVEALDRYAALRCAVRPELMSKGERLTQGDRRLELLVQVNISGEAAKRGCKIEEAAVLTAGILKAKNLRWEGLMTMAPYSEEPEAARPHFRALRELRDKLRRELAVSGETGLHLSMGMSGDFEPAVEEGATMVRIGTAIFG